MIVHFQHKEWPFIGKKPSMLDPGEIGGANAPPNSPTMLRKRGFCRVSAAKVWPDGHTLLVGQSGISFCIYLQFVSSFDSRILTKWPWILGFNRSILRGFFSTGFQPLDFALIS